MQQHGFQLGPLRHAILVLHCQAVLIAMTQQCAHLLVEHVLGQHGHIEEVEAGAMLQQRQGLVCHAYICVLAQYL